MIPHLIKGNRHQDSRGSLLYNNQFNSTAIKRFYVIENATTDCIRAWRGHQIEARWFSAIQGSFSIELIAVDNWEQPSKTAERMRFELQSETLDILHIPAGYVTSIQSLVEGSKLLVMSDFLLGEIDDEYRFDADYFD